jgi:cell fate regulator YaaT (PSP1 superfamily)
MEFAEYLVSYGSAGYFGRFRPTGLFACRRGDRVVVRTHRGVELGTVLCPATVGHAQLLGGRPAGQLLRPASADDEHAADRLAAAGARALTAARQLSAELALPLEIIDAEWLAREGEASAEPGLLVLHYLAGGPTDPRPLVSTLAKQFNVYVELADATAAVLDPDPPAEDLSAALSCGAGGCGSCGTGGCGSCGAGGCGSCTAPAPEPADAWQEQLVELRAKC